MGTAQKISLKFQYMGHELQVTESGVVIYKGEARFLWSIPDAMRNDIDIAYGRLKAGVTDEELARGSAMHDRFRSAAHGGAVAC